MHTDHARPDELPDALALIFRHLRDDERHWRVDHSLELIERGDLDARGVFVARGAAGLAGALVCSLVEGGGSLIWPPGLPLTPRPPLPQRGEGEIEDALVRAACAWLRGRGALLTQCLMSPEETAQAAPLLRNGFGHITDLVYLQHDLFLSAALAASGSRLRFEAYRPENPDELHRTLERTYQDTLDCPELNGTRGIDEVIRGHRAQGLFDPSRWWLARAGGEPAGVLMLMEQPESGTWEVAYMGVVPAFRGRGVGREMLLHGLCESKAGGAERLTLSVDARNTPACRLYHAAGFEPYDRRAVFLAVWTE